MCRSVRHLHEEFNSFEPHSFVFTTGRKPESKVLHLTFTLPVTLKSSQKSMPNCSRISLFYWKNQYNIAFFGDISIQYGVYDTETGSIKQQDSLFPNKDILSIFNLNPQLLVLITRNEIIQYYENGEETISIPQLKDFSYNHNNVYHDD